MNAGRSFPELPGCFEGRAAIRAPAVDLVTLNSITQPSPLRCSAGRRERIGLEIARNERVACMGQTFDETSIG
jgi:hypothetical protein